jgi:hypothetical protein
VFPEITNPTFVEAGFDSSSEFNRPLRPDIPDPRSDLCLGPGRRTALAMGAACMFPTFSQEFFLGLGPDCEVTIHPEILATQLFLFFFVSHGLILLST